MKSHANSKAAFARAVQLMPGGVNSPARAFGGVALPISDRHPGNEPIFIARADGAYLTDIDGHRYVDYIGSWGPMILGHQHPAVNAALADAIGRGTSFGAPTVAENRLAELIVAAVPSIEKIRLVNSGTEATMSAIRLARGFTGRDAIVKFAGNYHGHVDSLLVAAGSSAATLGAPSSPGVTAGTTKDTLVLEFNDVPALEAAFAAHGNRIAAVIVEAMVGNMGCVVPSPAFRDALRTLTTRHGNLLILDEVMSGFRVAYGGAQALWNMQPDLTTLGKIIGGGLPVGAYGGRADVMNHVLPSGKVFQAGTLSGNPLATAAGIATLTTLRDTDPYPQLEATSARLAAGLSAAAAQAGVAHTLCRVGSMMTVFFQADPVTNWTTAARCDAQMYARFFWAMLDRGVYLPCSQYEALFVSIAHGTAEIDATIAAAGEAFRECASGSS